MNNFNKTNVLWGLKVLFLFVLAILTIATCAGVWNAGLDRWVSWSALALFLAVGYVIARDTIVLLKEKPGVNEPIDKL